MEKYPIDPRYYEGDKFYPSTEFESKPLETQGIEAALTLSMDEDRPSHWHSRYYELASFIDQVGAPQPTGSAMEMSSAIPGIQSIWIYDTTRGYVVLTILEESEEDNSSFRTFGSMQEAFKEVKRRGGKEVL